MHDPRKLARAHDFGASIAANLHRGDAIFVVNSRKSLTETSQIGLTQSASAFAYHWARSRRTELDSTPAAAR
jgi:hypothetical protein